jgi:hypothetical protein
MRVPGLVVLGVLIAVLALAPAAEAQFSPQGIIGAATAPLRDMLGHFPRGRRHSAPARHVASAPPAAAANTRLAQFGPPAWPSAYADALGYVFWPGDYGREVRDRGFDVIAQTIAGPFPTAATTGAAPRDSAGDCNDAAGAANDWPQAQIEKTTQLADPQRQALQEFQAAFEQSTKAVHADCANPGDSSAPARLGGLIQALWAVRDTGLFVRQPLIEFNNSLGEVQKTAFAVPAQATPQPAASAPSKELQACAAQNIGEAERMVKVIGARARPDKQQSASLQGLHKVSVDMAKLLAATCAKPVPADFVSRLDAVNDQLTTMNYAATSVQIAFADFYRRLDARQKSRLNSGR